MLKYGRSLISCLTATFYASTALATVDISTIPENKKVTVSSWNELKAAVESSSNAGKVIILTKDIIVDINNPIQSVGGDGIITNSNNVISTS